MRHTQKRTTRAERKQKKHVVRFLIKSTGRAGWRHAPLPPLLVPRLFLFFLCNLFFLFSSSFSPPSPFLFLFPLAQPFLSFLFFALVSLIFILFVSLFQPKLFFPSCSCFASPHLHPLFLFLLPVKPIPSFLFLFCYSFPVLSYSIPFSLLYIFLFLFCFYSSHSSLALSPPLLPFLMCPFFSFHHSSLSPLLLLLFLFFPLTPAFLPSFFLISSTFHRLLPFLLSPSSISSSFFYSS